MNCQTGGLQTIIIINKQFYQTSESTFLTLIGLVCSYLKFCNSYNLIIRYIKNAEDSTKTSFKDLFLILNTQRQLIAGQSLT